MNTYEEATTQPFETYISHVFVTLSHLKISSNHNSALCTRIVDTCFTCCLLSFSFLLIISEALDVKEGYDLPSYAARINPLMFHLVGFFKWTYCIVNYGDIQKMIDDMEECHLLCQRIGNSVEARRRYASMMKKFQKGSMTFVTLWMTMCISGVVQWCSNPIIYDSLDVSLIENNDSVTFTRHLPYFGWFPWKMESLTTYIIYFTFQFAGGLGSGIGIGAYDILNLTYSKLISVQMEFLIELLLNEVSTPMSHEKLLSNVDFKTNLEKCVVIYKQILKVFERIEDISNLPMFVQCSLNIISLCMVSLEASTMKVNSSIETVMRMISMGEYWGGINLESFTYCYFATRIHTLGLEISDAFYRCHWENYLDKGKSIINVDILIILSICRAQKPMQISGGPFYNLTLETFRAVCRTALIEPDIELTSFSLSNAIVLRQLSDRE